MSPISIYQAVSRSDATMSQVPQAGGQVYYDSVHAPQIQSLVGCATLHIFIYVFQNFSVRILPYNYQG